MTFCLIAAGFFVGCKTMAEIPDATRYPVFSITFVCEPGAFNPGEFYQYLSPSVHCGIDVQSIQTSEWTTMEKVQIRVYTTAGEWPAIRMRLIACLSKIFPANMMS